MPASVALHRHDFGLHQRPGRHPRTNALAFAREVRALRCTCTAGRASKDEPPCAFILRGAQGRAPQDDERPWKHTEGLLRHHAHTPRYACLMVSLLSISADVPEARRL